MGVRPTAYSRGSEAGCDIVYSSFILESYKHVRPLISFIFVDLLRFAFEHVHCCVDRESGSCLWLAVPGYN